MSFTPSSIDASSGTTVRLRHAGAGIGPVAVWRGSDPCQTSHANRSVPPSSLHQFPEGACTLDIKIEADGRQFFGFLASDSRPYCGSGRMLRVNPMNTSHQHIPCSCKSDGVWPTASRGLPRLGQPSSGMRLPDIVSASNIPLPSIQPSSTGASVLPSSYPTGNASGHALPPAVGKADRDPLAGCMFLLVSLNAFFCLL